jgi:cytochrome c peroxidase
MLCIRRSRVLGLPVIALASACLAALASCGGSTDDAVSAHGVAAAAPPSTNDKVFALAAPAEQPALPNLLPSINDSGFAATYSLAGTIDRSGPFFQSLGTNGRSCATCHVQAEGWTITPPGVQLRFALSAGSDPIFRTNDGSNSPHADVSTVHARRRAYSMLLDKALVRVGIGIPANAEFELIAVDDPYGYASSAELSLFRRPLPTTNLRFLSTVMWDGRETLKDPGSTDCIAGTNDCFASIHFDLAHQSNGATVGHAQAAQPLTGEQREAIVEFEMGLFTAQLLDWRAGLLTARGTRGGPIALSQLAFYFGINDTLVGDYRSGAPFAPTVMTLYDAWSEVEGQGPITQARRSIARGQQIFNTKPIAIRGVGGINDDLGIDVLPGTCTTCHNAPNAGNHSIPMPLNLGLTDASRRTPDMPLYTLRNKTTGDLAQTTDPGRALITGKWKDIGRFKGPTLRALAARAPYFHNGMARDLAAVVDFYDMRFAIELTPEEKADLVAFLRAL